MGEELEMLVFAHVVLDVLVDGACVVGAQLLDGEGKGLLVAFHHGAAARVADAADAWRYYVVDGLAVVVFLDVDGGDGEVAHAAACAAACVERAVVAAPVSVDEVEGAESQYYGVSEVGHVHTHEPDAREVGDAAYGLAAGVVEGYAYEVPLDLVGRAVAQGD